MVDADDAGNGGVVVAGSGATGDADTETDDPLKAEIMRATYRALIEQGYSDLTIQGIADEFPKSKSLLYYHYDGKDDLIASFLGFATDRFRREIEVEIDDPEAQLRALVDQLVPESLDEGEYRVQVALLELRSETPHNERFRQQYAVVDDALKSDIADVLRRGIESGAFATDVNPDTEAEVLVSLLTGVRTLRLSTYERFPVAETRAALDGYLDRLLADSEA
ncbi:TetR/AcrR family transcriptional regulator [Halorubrum lacusprofundi]|uniref:Transcriptional regulator, TetR family n=1 Tax=Halorubrum lacusprofundi (strain ATCC 49239 / DSM 5036 / JCM 8891 / ACAM 34) TaxID=416348 RepID=B9LQG4_HALLT|nr:TetR/AcrR family transcriptional regulator [Halorubrum lacusprofundi]ACM57585.1 transcriptional regulator, TetR family [Halorubrum lacusprofundi ATCC 49239]MCG1005818.1 TetR family transcriptional regulator [Halorubrum lacusprofundi]